MTMYNAERTAYRRYWSDTWYLVPEGKRRAPLFFLGEGPILWIHKRYDRLTDEHMHLLTKKDRVILLESTNAGCFEDMWKEMKNVLRSRSEENLATLVKFVEGSSSDH